MAVRPWLDTFRARLVHNRSRRPERRSRLQQSRMVAGLQPLEDRALLSAAVNFAAGNLQVLSDADEAIVIQENPAAAGLVEVLINGAPNGAFPNLAADQVTAIQITAGASSNVVDLSGVNAAAFPNLAAIVVGTGDGDDTIVGSPDFANAVSAGDGHDVITGGSQNDTLLGDDGDDTILGGAGNDDLNGGDGDDSVSGEDGRDTIVGDDGDDILTGDADDDSLVGGDGDDSLLGDIGNDTIVGNQGADTIESGEGDDVVFAGGGNDQVNGDLGNDSITGNGGHDTVTGGDGDDTISSGGGADSVDGGLGADSLIGGLGDDTLIGDDGNDNIRGGGGNDLVFGDGQDTMNTAVGDDTIHGNSGDDTLIGVTGNDSIDGGDGNDEIRSTFELVNIEPPPPPPPPVLPPSAPTTPRSLLDDAVDSGGGVNVGAFHTLDNGPGDATVMIPGVDAFGEFNSAIYDPVGPQTPADTTFESEVYFRMGASGARQNLALAGMNPSTIRGLTDEANSSFTVGSLTFQLTQTLEPLTDPMGIQNGTLLTQTFRITNSGTTGSNFELVRYIDGDLLFDGTLVDGGGRFTLPGGEEILFETDAGGTGSTSTTFLGITSLGGMIPATNRYEIDSFSGLRTRIAGGNALDDIITGDGNGDEFIDAGAEYDVTLAMRNLFMIGAGATDTYTTHTLFGTGQPDSVAANDPPIAVSDAANLVTAGGNDITIDVVSNDSDPDGALDFTSVTIITPPMAGTVVSLGNGLVTYTADPGFRGTDTFEYTIADNLGAISNPGLVRVTVSSIDDSGDTLLGGDGNDTITGLDGDDLIVGGAGNDIADGRSGRDSMLGGAGNDLLNGGPDEDTLKGNGGRDTLNGESGEDELHWRGIGDGQDSLNGGDRGDTAVVTTGGTDDTLTIQQTTFNGLLEIIEGVAILTIDDTISHVRVHTGNGRDTVTLGDLSRVRLTSLTVNGGEANDRLDAGPAVLGSVRLNLNGEGGNDTLIGSNAAENLRGGDDDDDITGRGGDDSIRGDSGADTIDAGSGDDSVDGGDGDDSIIGGFGNDSLSGGLDSDVLVGGDGFDTLRGGFGDDRLIGGADADSMSGGSGRDKLIGGGGLDRMDGGRNDDTLVGNSGDDTLLGNHGNDFIDAGFGNDEILGGDGNDTVRGGAGDDGIAGNDGNDLLIGDLGRDVIRGNDGDDTLRGGGSRDTLLGDEGIDAINGNGGTDTAAVGEGLDPAPRNVEVIDESFVLSSQMLEKLDGV